MIRVICKSVIGGWQTCVKDTDYCFGPTFNRIQDLWAWQRANLFASAAEVA